VDIQELRVFLKDSSPQKCKSSVSNGFPYSSPLLAAPDATKLRVKPDPDGTDACFSPDLSNPIKMEQQLEDMLDLSFDASDVSKCAPVGTRQIKEGGKEIFLILDSDSEGEDPILALPSLREDAMSSDTAVNSDFGGAGIDSDSEADDDRTDQMSDIEIELPQTLWLDDGLVSRVVNKPCKVTRQRTVERVEYLNDIPSYWPIPEDLVAYVLDLSDSKFDIKNKDGDLLPVDTLICDKVSKMSFL
jgi:hypothetical protein